MRPIIWLIASEILIALPIRFAETICKGAQRSWFGLRRATRIRAASLNGRELPKSDLDSMPVTQVALLGPWLKYQKLRDQLQKWALYAYAHADRSMFNKIDQAARIERPDIEPFHHLIPPVGAFARAQQRQARWLAAIATIEALRMYAADKGAWPAKLEDITQVPLPKNPDDNKPFAYKLDGDIAVLTAPYTTGIMSEYRLKLRKK